MYNKNFYNDLDLKYPEIAIALETNSNKFYIPVLMGLIEGAGSVPITINTRVSSSNIRNKNNNLAISSVTKQNYITLSVPSYLYYEDHNITGIKWNKGDKFIIVFVGGDINKIRIIGRY